MNRPEHLFIGYVVGIILILATHMSFEWFPFTAITIMYYAVIIFVYALLPDADHRSSTISFIFVGVSILGMAYGYNYKNNAMLYFSYGLVVTTFAAWTIGHRGFVHSILFGLIVSVPLMYFFSYQVAILGFVSFMTHMWADGEYFKLY